MKLKEKLAVILGLGGVLLLLAGFMLSFGVNLKKQSIIESLVVLNDTKVVAKNDGKLVYVSGYLNPVNDIIDDKFLIERQALKLHRKVESYQQVGEDAGWTEKEVAGQKIKSIIFEANEMTIGDFVVGNLQIDAPAEQYERVDFQKIAAMKNKMMRLVKKLDVRKQEVLYSCVCTYDICAGSEKFEGMKGESYNDITLAEKRELYKTAPGQDNGWRCHINQEAVENGQNKALLEAKRDYIIYKNYLYFGKDPTEPKIGDLRISYYELNPQIYSIIGKQDYEILRRFSFDSVDMHLMRVGKADPQVMVSEYFDQKYDKNDWPFKLALVFILLAGILFVVKRK